MERQTQNLTSAHYIFYRGGKPDAFKSAVVPALRPGSSSNCKIQPACSSDGLRPATANRLTPATHSRRMRSQRISYARGSPPITTRWWLSNGRSLHLDAANTLRNE